MGNLIFNGFFFQKTSSWKMLERGKRSWHQRMMGHGLLLTSLSMLEARISLGQRLSTDKPRVICRGQFLTQTSGMRRHHCK